MHYRNGREAKAGDSVVWLQPHSVPFAGIIHSPNEQASTCNARLSLASSSDPYVNLSDCLHIDDVAEAFPKAVPQEDQG